MVAVGGDLVASESPHVELDELFRCADNLCSDGKRHVSAV